MRVGFRRPLDRPTVKCVQRVLDIDLDFFVTPVVHWPQWDGRAPGRSMWTVDDAIAFLRDVCGLDTPLPGFVTETHDELYWRWKDAITSGVLQAPFHVTHLDAHADLGLGDSGWPYLMTDLLHLDVDARTNPRTGGSGLNEGNFLAFAIAAGWIAGLEYVYGEGGNNDELAYLMQNFDKDAGNVQLKAITPDQKDDLLRRGRCEIERLEPPVPYRTAPAAQYTSTGVYDFVCRARSPLYTPEAADVIFDEIRTRFIADVATMQRR